MPGIGNFLKFDAGLRGLAAACAIGASFLVAANVAAQTIPPSADPSRIPQRFDTPRTPTVDPRLETPNVQPALPPEQARRVRFVLRGVEIAGSTVYPSGELATYYQSLVGKEISAFDAYGI